MKPILSNNPLSTITCKHIIPVPTIFLGLALIYFFTLHCYDNPRDHNHTCAQSIQRMLRSRASMNYPHPWLPLPPHDSCTPSVLTLNTGHPRQRVKRYGINTRSDAAKYNTSPLPWPQFCCHNHCLAAMTTVPLLWARCGHHDHS